VHRFISNKGVRSTGLTKWQPTKNSDYVYLVELLRKYTRKTTLYRATPLDSIYIPKKINIDISKINLPNPLTEDPYKANKNLRPISIPTIVDRCVQALWFIAIEPWAELNADPYSFGFRKRRSTIWAAHAIGLTLKGNFDPKWAVEIDISKCFDSISHKWIFSNIPFIDKHILTQWLKQGYFIRELHRLGKMETTVGVPQGGIISPIICNITLDGAQNFIRQHFINGYNNKIYTKQDLGYQRIRDNSQFVILVRYADDIVILAKTKLVATQAMEKFQEFLKPRGLELSETKTKITCLAGGSAEFDFLGFTFLKKTYAYTEKCFIIPSQRNRTRVKEKLSRVAHYSSLSMSMLFYKFNSILFHLW
jgi:RNA-directed DNA polymerase